MRTHYLFLLPALIVLAGSCHKDNHHPTGNPAVFLTTTAVYHITDTSATTGGTFNTSASAMAVSFKGIQWDTTNQFSNHWQTPVGSGATNFTTGISGLYPNYHYYVRAYAGSDSAHIVYGDTVQFTTTYTPGKYNVSTIAGTGEKGFADGDISVATFSSPFGVCVDPAGNIYVADGGNSAVRKITPSGNISTVLTQALYPNDVVSDTAGNIYLAAGGAYKIYKITASGQISVFAGSGHQAQTDGTGTGASFTSLLTLDIDPAGNLYVSDGFAFRKITPAGVVSTLPNNLPEVNACRAIGVDNHFNLYESDGNTIVKVDSSGNKTFLAGSSQKGSADGTGSAATFTYISELRTDEAGNLYAADVTNNKIRMITPAGVVTTVAGSNAAGDRDGNSAFALFSGPIGLAIDKAGNIIVADADNNKIRKISPL